MEALTVAWAAIAAVRAAPDHVARGLDQNVGSLPFTGWDMIILAGIALVLSGVGFGLRRLSAPPPRDL